MNESAGFKIINKIDAPYSSYVAANLRLINTTNGEECKIFKIERKWRYSAFSPADISLISTPLTPSAGGDN